jgi:hypothetical protein
LCFTFFNTFLLNHSDSIYFIFIKSVIIVKCFT